MAIQIAGGTIVNYTWTSDGTRGNMQSTIATQLGNAGWSTVSGGGTSDTLMQSATTPQGLRCQVRCYDPGSGNCAQFTMRDVAGIRISNAAFMLPTNGKQFRIVANKYQFFVFPTGSADTTVARETMMGGVPWVPANIVSIISNPDCFWFLFTGENDTTTTARAGHFRKQLVWTNATDFPGNAALFNDTLVQYTIANTTWQGPQLNLNAGPRASGSTGGSYTPPWKDGSFSIIDAVLGWGQVNVGQLWDACILCAIISGEQMELVPPDSTAKYMSITDSMGYVASCGFGTLLVRVLS